MTLKFLYEKYRWKLIGENIQKFRWFFIREEFLIMEDMLVGHRQREDRYKEAIAYLLRNNEDGVLEHAVTKFLQTGEWS